MEMKRILNARKTKGLGFYFCPSNRIAKDNELKARTLWSVHNVHLRELESLKKGEAQKELQEAKKTTRKLNKKLLTLIEDLKKEKEIANALGLGAWCNGAVARRKRAENDVANATLQIGKIKGEIEVLRSGQTTGLDVEKKTQKTIRKEIKEKEQEIADVKAKIQEYKDKRDRQKQKDILNKEKTAVTKSLKTAGFGIKNNKMLLLGMVVAGATLIYYGTSEKKEIKTKKVIA